MAENRPMNLKELVAQGYAFPSLRPEGMSDSLSERGSGYREKVLKNLAGSEFDASYYRNLVDRDVLLDVSKFDGFEKYVGFFVKDDYAGKSPAMFNSLFESLDLPYGAFMFVADPNDSEIIFEALRNDEKFLGGGFGVGFKEKYEGLDGIYPKGIMSINNIVRYAGTGRQRIIGYNTDASGFVSGLQKKFGDVGSPTIEGKNIVVLGAGAIAGDIVMELGSRGASGVSVLNRTISKADLIRDRVNARYSGLVVSGGEDEIEKYLLDGGKVDAVINVSIKGGDGPLREYSAFAAADVRSENGLVYNHDNSMNVAKGLADRNSEVVVADVQQRDTATLKIARDAGLVNLLNGNDMVVRQGVDAVKNIELGNSGIFGEGLKSDYIFKIFNGVVS